MPESESSSKEDGNSDLGWDDPTYIDFITFTADNPSAFIPTDDQVEDFWDIFRQRVYENQQERQRKRNKVKLLIYQPRFEEAFAMA